MSITWRCRDAFCPAVCATLLAAVAALTGYASEAEEPVQDPRIAAVETSLVEIASPEALFESRVDTVEVAKFTLAERMAHYKVPHHVVFGALPKTQTGKIQKFVLRETANASG